MISQIGLKMIDRMIGDNVTDISNKDSEQDVKIAVLDSTLENATRRMELIHKRIDRTDERITKLNEDVRERIRALEKWVWGAGAVLTAFVVIGGLDSIPGAIVGSIIIGLTQGYVAYYQFQLESVIGISLGNGFSLLAPYLIMFVILIFKPDGLFGTEEVERV